MNKSNCSIGFSVHLVFIHLDFAFLSLHCNNEILTGLQIRVQHWGDDQHIWEPLTTAGVTTANVTTADSTANVSTADVITADGMAYWLGYGLWYGLGYGLGHGLGYGLGYGLGLGLRG